MLVADDDARDHANLAEAAKREAKWREANYYIISMKNDFKTIYKADLLSNQRTGMSINAFIRQVLAKEAELAY